MPATLTDSEKFVLEICQNSCLEFWCYNNPSLPNGKELCDVLVVFGLHMLIISVKEIGLKAEGDCEGEEALVVAHRRWNRKAVEESINQIYGAEKSLRVMEHVLRSDGSLGAQLPDASSRKVHRLAVAFGSRGETVIVSGDYGKGFVHVMNEDSFTTILRELDTISELTGYLEDKEKLSETTSILLNGNEANLLAIYLFNARKLPFDTKILVVEEDAWQKLQADPLFQNRKKADAISYEWDRLISFIASADSRDPQGKPLTLSEKDLALREMAQETRVNRRALQTALSDFLKAGIQKKTDSRITRTADSSCIYVFRFFHFNESAEDKIAELQFRSMNAPKKAGAGEVSVGIGFAWNENSEDFEITLTFVQLSAMTEENSREVHKFAAENGIGEDSTISRMSVEEYPAE